MNRLFTLAILAGSGLSRVAIADECFDAPAVCDVKAGTALIATDPEAAAKKLLAAYELQPSADTLGIYSFALQQAHHYALAIEASTRARSMLEDERDKLTNDATDHAKPRLDQIAAELTSIDAQIANLKVVTGRITLRYSGDPKGIVVARRGGGDVEDPFSTPVVVDAGSDTLIVTYPTGQLVELPIHVGGGAEATVVVPTPPALGEPRPPVDDTARVKVHCGERDDTLQVDDGIAVNEDGIALKMEENPPSAKHDPVVVHVRPGVHVVSVSARGCDQATATLELSNRTLIAGELRSTERFRHQEGPAGSRASHIAITLGAAYETYTTHFSSDSSFAATHAIGTSAWATSSVDFTFLRWFEVAADAALSSDSSPDIDSPVARSATRSGDLKYGARLGLRLPFVFGSISAGIGLENEEFDMTQSPHVTSNAKWDQQNATLWLQTEFRPICNLGLGARAIWAENVSSNLTSLFGEITDSTSLSVGVYLSGGLELGGHCNRSNAILTISP